MIQAAPIPVRIDSIAAGGDGVARAGGLVIFIPRTAPGDVGTADVVPRGRFARGTLRSLEEPSPDRVEPPCQHYLVDRCGGCQLQHLGYEAQLRAKAGIVHDALRRIGRREAPLPEVRPSPARWRYRRKLTLAMRRGGAGWMAGLHPYDDATAVFSLHDCPITDERVVRAWRDLLAAGEHLPDEHRLRGAVRLENDALSFTLQGGRSWPASGAFFDALPGLASLWWEPEQGKRRMLAERGSAAPGAAFTQVNAGVTAELRAHVIARVLAHSPEHVVDAYAGLGDVALALAAAGPRVTAIELDRDAARWCGAQLPAGSRALAGRTEDLLPRALPADVVLLNPPRTGVDPRVTSVLEATAPRPRALVYVSCDPATLARDLARLGSYRIASLLSFDMFPQTAHVETVCELLPEGA